MSRMMTRRRRFRRSRFPFSRPPPLTSADFAALDTLPPCTQPPNVRGIPPSPNPATRHMPVCRNEGVRVPFNPRASPKRASSFFQRSHEFDEVQLLQERTALLMPGVPAHVNSGNFFLQWRLEQSIRRRVFRAERLTCSHPHQPIGQHTTNR